MYLGYQRSHTVHIVKEFLHVSQKSQHQFINEDRLNCGKSIPFIQCMFHLFHLEELGKIMYWCIWVSLVVVHACRLWLCWICSPYGFPKFHMKTQKWSPIMHVAPHSTSRVCWIKYIIHHTGVQLMTHDGLYVTHGQLKSSCVFLKLFYPCHSTQVILGRACDIVHMSVYDHCT